ncbi:MAG: M16 family metallopeptidase [Planctomycetota bacterium]|jgi:predicted Zn-dependent peptidase
MEFKHKQLDNGLTVIGEVNPAAQSASVGFFVRTGSRDETAAISGVSHFLEHMMFKGTETLSALEVNEAFDRLGAKFNAFTSEENTVYYAAVLPEYLEDVSVLWMQLMRAMLRDDDFNMEKNVILEEIAMYKDLPQFEVMDQGRALHFGAHCCGNSVLGTNDSIGALTADQMRTYFASRYAPNNMVLACCGNFDFDGLCKLAEQHCGGWQTMDSPRPLSAFEGTFEKKHVQTDNLVRQHLCLLSPTVSMQDSQRYAASLLAMILGDETGSRYYWSLVDPAMADAAGMHCESMDGAGVFYSYICCAPEKVEKVVETLNSLLADVSANGVTEAELETARNKVLSAMTLKCEQPMGRLVSLGFNWIYNHEYMTVGQEVQQIKDVTLADINGLIEQLNPARYTLMSLGPKQI